MGKRVPKIYFDYQYLAGLDSQESVGEVFLLSEPSQQVLSMLADMVLWTKTRWFNGSEQEIETLAHRIYEELKVPLHFDDLIPFVDEIETLLREIKALSGCCPTNVTPFPPPAINDPGYGYDGPFPDTWAENEPVSSLDDYRAILCYQAHKYIDYLVQVGPQLDGQIASAVLTVGALAAILGILAGAGILAPLAYGAVATITSAILGSWVASIFTDASVAIEANRNTIMCAILTGDASIVRATVQGFISSEAWTLFFQWIDYQKAIWTMETGELGGEYLEVGRRYDCSCGPQPSGLRFVRSGGVLNNWVDNTPVDGNEVYYGMEYKLTGGNPLNGWNMRFTAIGTTTPALPVTIQILELRRDNPDNGGTYGTTEPGTRFKNPSNQIIQDIPRASEATTTGTWQNVGYIDGFGKGRFPTTPAQQGFMRFKVFPYP